MKKELIEKIATVLATAIVSIVALFEGAGGEAEEPAAPKAGGKSKGKPAPKEEEVEEPSKSLGALADEGDDDAIEELTEKAEKAGIDPDDFETWAEVEEALAPKGKASGKKGGVTLASLREKAKPIIRAGHSEELKELLETYDADSLATLDEDEFEKFDKSLDKLAKRLGV